MTKNTSTTNLRKVGSSSNINNNNSSSISNNKNEFLEEKVNENFKKCNILEPTKQNLYIIKSLFDFQKQNKYNIFDYSDYKEQIILLQKNLKGFIARKKYQSAKYGIYCINVIQKVYRGYVKRKKFNKFRVLIKHILLIQRVFKSYYNKKVENVIKLQCMYRKFAARKLHQEKKNKRLMRILIYLEETGQISNINDPNLWENFDLSKYSLPAEIDFEEEGMTEENVKLGSELENISQKSIIKSKSYLNAKEGSVAQTDSSVNNGGIYKKAKVSKKPRTSLQNHLELIRKLEGAGNDEIVFELLKDVKKSVKDYYANPYSSTIELSHRNSLRNFNKKDLESLGVGKMITKKEVKVSIFNFFISISI